jgi:protocatechuate 3,4-dioxygenase beta subunit
MLPALYSLGITTILTMQLSPSVVARPQSGGEKKASNSRRNGIITGRVMADDGRPLSDVEIMAGAIGGDIFDSRRAETDDEGNFKLTGLKPGAYKIEAALPGYVSLKNASGAQFYRNGDNVTIRMMKGGVITGRVTDARGEPLEMVFVNLLIAHDLEGRDASSSLLLREIELKDVLTDDRGVYRAYGLLPGKYVVSVIDIPIRRFNSGSIPHDSPTYYPSVKREAATEVTVRSGEEVTGVDIIHRGERGYSITGVVSSRSDPISYMSSPVVSLINKSNAELEAVTSVTGVFDYTSSNGSRSFSLHGVSDGEYVLTASSGFSRSTPLNITVKGEDVTGLSLRLINAGSISGRVVVESPKPGEGCGGKTSVEEIFLRVRKFDATDLNQATRLIAINQEGDFIQPLEDGVYRIIPDLPGDSWYVRAIARTAKETPNKTIDVAREGVAVKSGESLTGVEILIAEGAARLRGRVAVTDETQAKDGDSAQPRWRVSLIPAEEAAAENVLRYAETLTRSDASFELMHVAPGKYYLLAQKVSEKEPIDDQSRPAAWDNSERAKLRREAQTLKQEIELRPCQQINDYSLRASAKPR